MRTIAWLASLGIALAPAPAAAVGPRALITDGPAGETPATTARFAFEADGPAPATSFECRLDGGPWRACSSPAELTGLEGGPHAFEVRLVGLVADSKPARRDWVVQQQTVVVDPCASGGCPNPGVQPPAPVPPPPRDPARRDAGGCAYGANQPGEVAAARLRAAVVCLINRERRRRDLRPVRGNAALERAAGAHARDMVRRRYFDHVSPGGSTVVNRVARAGYLGGTQAWTVGEVLAWLVRPRPTPAATVRAWMDSPPHRAILVRPAFRDAGIDFARGNPRTRGGATWAGVLGRRR